MLCATLISIKIVSGREFISRLVCAAFLDIFQASLPTLVESKRMKFMYSMDVRPSSFFSFFAFTIFFLLRIRKEQRKKRCLCKPARYFASFPVEMMINQKKFTCVQTWRCFFQGELPISRKRHISRQDCSCWSMKLV